MYYATFGQMKKMLGQLDKWLDAATAFAQTKSFDPNAFLEFRLAPDQFAFARQVQITCDTAKLGASRLSGKDARLLTVERVTRRRKNPRTGLNPSGCSVRTRPCVLDHPRRNTPGGPP